MEPSSTNPFHDAVPPALIFRTAPPGLLLYFLGSAFRVNTDSFAENGHVEPHTFPRHAALIARPFASLPKPASSLLDKTRMTNATVLGSVILFSGTVPAYHSIGVLVRMITFAIVTFVAGEHL